MSRDSEYLTDIVSSARLILTYIEGVRRDQFLRDMKLQDSVIRRIEIIGEAVRRLSPELRDRHPNVPWQAMTGMRNRMIHGYDDIDMDVVWDTAQDSIPRLLSMIEPLVRESA